jgi:asparagine synthase (glutamine-hydrolysing)
MCGIAAVFGSIDGTVSVASFARMVTMIEHRGPDDEGYLILSRDGEALVPTPCSGDATPDTVIAAHHLTALSSLTSDDCETRRTGLLGHRRLSILDLSAAGHQPMCYLDDRYWVVFNGEIFNFLELREELEEQGYAFRSSSDTEVIAAAYAHWGDMCVHHFNGMWAFVLVDTATGTAFVSRDRFGVKPLYYWYSPSGFIAFASEIKQFTVLPGWDPVLNGPRAYDYLNHSLIDHTRETLFTGVYQLRGGQSATFLIDAVPETLPITQWYHLEPGRYPGRFEAATEIFFSLFESAVRFRLRSDVPVGSCLSGGLDSSSIVCMADRLLHDDSDLRLKTFTACSWVERFDERCHAERVVESVGADPHYIYPDSAGLCADLERLIWHQDEPFTSTSMFAQWSLFKEIAESGVKVVLDGQGADEQLAGYPSFFPYYHIGLLLGGHPIQFRKELEKARELHGIDTIPTIKNILVHHWTRALSRLRQRLSPRKVDHPWLNLAILEPQLDAIPSPKTMDGAVLQELSLIQILSTSIPMLLHWEDRDSMAHSVESRVPFLDYRLVEFLLALPPSFKISGGVTKRVLRSAMTSLLPREIAERRDKMGFLTAEEIWVTEGSPETFRTLLEDAIANARGVLATGALDDLDAMIRGDRPYDPAVWRMICFGNWMNLFRVRIASGSA